jgi:hypothetical protein
MTRASGFLRKRGRHIAPRGEPHHIFLMRLNSAKSLELARAVLREHGGDWDRVRESGRVRDDGVIVVKRPASAGPTSAGKRASDDPSRR